MVAFSPVASAPIAALPDELMLASTATLQLPVDYYMEDLPQYREIGRTFERMKGKAGEEVKMSAGVRGRLSGPAPSFKTTKSGRGYD